MDETKKLIDVEGLSVFLEGVRKEMSETAGVTYTFEQSGTTLIINGSDGYHKEITMGEEITSAKIISALGYTPADTDDIPSIEGLATVEQVNAKYTKPEGGIPKNDLAEAVKTSLGKADTALQSFTETDPIFVASPAYGITTENITAWNNKSDFSGSYNDLSDKPTIPTVTDTYSSTSSDAMSGKAVASGIASAIEGVTQFDYEVVTSLPSTGVKGKIYLIANEKGTQDVYDEYLWINGAWEKIGTTKIDLSNYYNKTEVDGLLNGKISTTDVITDAELDTLFTD